MRTDMPYHHHAPLGTAQRRDGESWTFVLIGSSQAAGQRRAKRLRIVSYHSGRTCRDWTAGYPTAETRVKAQSDHQGNLSAFSVKAMRQRKEWVNILFAGKKWGVTNKGPKSFTAERVFVNPDLDPAIIGEEVYQELTLPDPQNARKRVPRYPDFLFLTKYNESGVGPMFTMVTEPDAVETFIGHVSGPQGPRSNLTRVEVVSGATIHVQMQVLRDEIQHHHWPIIFLTGQEEGLGAMRSQGYGRYDLVRFERVGGKFPELESFEELVAKIDKDDVLRAYQEGKAVLKAKGEITDEATEGLVPLGEAPKRRANGRSKKDETALSSAGSPR